MSTGANTGSYNGSLRRIVIVGGGLAATSAAERLRERGYDHEIVLISGESRQPYHRPPLSKQLLLGSVQPVNLRIRTYTALAAQWRVGVSAQTLDPGTRTLGLSDGSTLAYDALIIATGVNARTLPTAPMDSPHVWTLRTLDDARAIDRAIGQSERQVAVVGGGFIGCEIASTARARALPATIIDLSPTLLFHSLGPVLGSAIGDIHRRAGVRLHLGTAVDTWEPHDGGVRLRLHDNEHIDANVVIVGVGTSPATGWLDGSGIDVTDGVLCAPDCTVIDTQGTPIPGVVAAGDVARWPNHRFDHEPRRVEHWINAIEMGRHCADTTLDPDSSSPFTPIPRFWSEQHGTRIQAAGIPALGDEITLTEGTTTTRSSVTTYTRKGTLVGVVTINAPRRLQHYTSLIGGPASSPPGR